jgi:hypothetical protein
VRRRVLQCYTKLVELSPASSSEVLLQTNLLPFAIASFAEPDNYTSSSFSTAIASAAGTIESIWEVADNHGFGVTGLVRGYDIKPLPGEHETGPRHHWVTRHGPEAVIDRTVCFTCPSRLRFANVPATYTYMRSSRTRLNCSIRWTCKRLHRAARPTSYRSRQRSTETIRHMSTATNSQDPGEHTRADDIFSVSQ